MKQLIDCEFLKLVCWLSPCEQHTAVTCVMFGGAELLFQITYCAPFIPDAKKHSNHPATQPRDTGLPEVKAHNRQELSPRPGKKADCLCAWLSLWGLP